MKQRHESKVNPKLQESIIVRGFPSPGSVADITNDTIVSVRLGGIQLKYKVERHGKQLVAVHRAR